MNPTYCIGKIAPLNIGQEINLQVTNPDDQVLFPLYPNDPVILVPDDNTDPPVYRSYHYYGTVTDQDSGDPLPGATVKVYGNDNLLKGMASDNSGYFDCYTDIEADSVQITSTGYIGKLFPLNLISHDFSLAKDVKVIDPVVVTASRKNDWLLLLLAGVVIYEESKNQKKKVGSINTGNVIAVGAGLFMLMGFKSLKDLLIMLGLAPGPGQQGSQNEQTNPNSPWKPAFWKSAPPNTTVTLITEAGVQEWTATIHGAFTVLQDDFNQIMSVFSGIKTKSQVSYLADKFQQRYGEDLLSFLKDGGGVLPWDGLSDKHLKILIDLVNSLPQYKP